MPSAISQLPNPGAIRDTVWLLQQSLTWISIVDHALLPLLGVVVGAALGAWAHFVLERRLFRGRKQHERLWAVHKAVIDLGRAVGALKSVLDQISDDVGACDLLQPAWDAWNCSRSVLELSKNELGSKVESLERTLAYLPGPNTYNAAMYRRVSEIKSYAEWHLRRLLAIVEPTEDTPRSDALGRLKGTLGEAQEACKGWLTPLREMLGDTVAELDRHP
jgi:hypothetical protein